MEANARAAQFDVRAAQFAGAALAISSSRADPLSGLAPLLRVRPELESLCRFGAQWASPHKADRDGWVPFHIVAAGACVLETAGCAPLDLGAGDVALLPHGAAHSVRSAIKPAGGLTPLELDRSGAILIKSNGTEPETELVCGRLRFELAHDNLVLSALPPALVVRTSDGPDAARMRLLVSMIRDELNDTRPGAAAIAADLASSLMVMVLRVHLEREGADLGLLRLLAHRQGGAAVAAMLENPARDWTLDALAAVAGASRATLVRIFQGAAGMAPLAFLTELRMGLALRKLAMRRLSLGRIAEQVGYQSESAFSRAFQRRFGLPPGEARRASIKTEGPAVYCTSTA